MGRRYGETTYSSALVSAFRVRLRVEGMAGVAMNLVSRVSLAGVALQR
jgi:hypothetical protein